MLEDTILKKKKSIKGGKHHHQYYLHPLTAGFKVTFTAVSPDTPESGLKPQSQPGRMAVLLVFPVFGGSLQIQVSALADSETGRR